MSLFFLVPLLLVFAISLASRGTYGGIVWEFTWANYLDLWHPLYGKILGQSLWYATLTTAICFLLGFPLAYVIARSPARWQPVLLLLVMLPFWTNFLVRTYAWMIILRHDGLANNFLLALGLIAEPLELLYTPTAVWREKDSNLRRQSRQIYSLIPLATLVSLQLTTHNSDATLKNCQTIFLANKKL